MNANEREQLQQFLNQLTQTRAQHKDSEAEKLIQAAVAQQQDAAYLLVQRSLLLEQALNQAKLQIESLQQQNTSNRFLGNDPWAQTPNPAPTYQATRVPPNASNPSWLGGGSGFLGNVATTAAGVVAGSFLFQGIESLLGHHGGMGGWHSNQSGWGEQIAEQTVVNNYYGDDAIREANFTPDDNSYITDDDSFNSDGDSDSDWM